ncbi:MAG: tyrosine-type recombinase/integrase [bacterium]
MKHRTGHIFKRANSNTFYLRYVINGKVMQQALYNDNGEAITSAKDAEQARVKIMSPFTVADEAGALENVKAKLEGRRHELEVIDEQRNPALPLQQAWGTFIKSHNRPDTGTATLRVYALTWGRFLKWITGAYPDVKTLRAVTPEIAGEYAAHLTAEKLSPNTFNKYMNLLSLVFRTVAEKARLTKNPWEDIQRKRLVTHGRRELTIAELRAVCTKATGDLRLMVAIGLYTGLRLGDCATLRWAEVDLARGIILRIPNKTGRRSQKPVMVPIHQTLRALLEEEPKSDRTEYVLPRIAADYARHHSYVTDRMQALFKKCEIQTTRAVECQKMAQVEVGFHSLRHSFVSLCREANAPLAVVEAIVGHSNPAMTRHYTHTGEAAAIAAVAGLPSIMTEEEPKALPPAPAPRLVDADAVLTIFEGANSKNWQSKVAELHVLAEKISRSDGQSNAS